MPTTCGFPNCKFRSRYRGQEDNRHFYRIPKRPPILRQAWLCAIGRSEETVVSQLRICSAHFYGGEKREGDIPVADPQIDPPEFIELPPKESRSSERRARLKGHSSSSALLSAPSALFSSMSGERPQLPSLIRTGSAARRGERRNMRLLHFGGANRFSSMGFAAMAGKGTQQQQSNHGGGIFAVGGGVTTTTTPCSPAQPEQKQQERASVEGVEGGGAADKPNSSASSSSFIFPQHQQSSSQFATSSAFLSSLFGMNKLPANTVLQSNHALSRITPPVATQFAGTKPLVALLDGRDCSIEMPLLKDIATVAFCDAQTTGEIHEKVLNEATAALLYHSISLGRDDLVKFKALKVVVRIGSGVHNVDVQAASEQGIAVCHMAAECVEETADSTMSLILSMFRRTFWLSRTIHSGKQPNGIEQLRELMAGSTRIRGSTLGLIGLGRVGMAMAQRAKSFGFNVAVYDPHISLGIERSIGVERYENLAEMLNRCDCVSLHCPLQPDTRHIINADTIKAIKFGAFLVNTGQPELCQSNALLSALKTGHIRAAAFDYVGAQVNRGGEREILEVLSSLPNVICTPHCAWYSDESSRELREAAAREVRRALTGTVPEDLRNCVNRTELMALKRFVGQMAPQQFPASPPVAPLFPNLIAQQQQRHSAQQRNAAGTAMQLQQREFGGATLGTTPGQFSMPGLVSLCAQSNLTENPSNPMPSFLNTDNALSAYQQHLLMLQPHLIQHIAQQNAAAKFGAALSRETGSGTIAALPPDTNNDMNCVQQQHLVVDEPMESSGGTELGGNSCATAASDGMLDLRDEQDASKLESENGRAHSVDELSVRNNNATPPSFTQPQSHKYITSFQSNSSPNSARICGENEVKKPENGQLKED